MQETFLWSFLYAVTNGFEDQAEEERKISANKKYKGTIKKKYRYIFLNSRNSFGNRYVLSKSLQKRLASKLVAAGYFPTLKRARKAIERIVAKPWGGSCYGIALSTVLNKKKQINVRKYTKSKGKGYQLSRVAKPKTNIRTAYIINYYHAAQAGFNQDEEYKSTTDSKALKRLVDTAKRGYVISFGFRMKEGNKDAGGHRILILGYSKKKSNNNWYALKTYDSSYSTGARYLFVSKKYNCLKVQGWSNYYKVYLFRMNTNFAKYNKVKI